MITLPNHRHWQTRQSLTLAIAIAVAAGCGRASKPMEVSDVKVAAIEAISNVEDDADDSTNEVPHIVSEERRSDEPVATIEVSPDPDEAKSKSELAPLEPAVPWPAASERLNTLSHGGAVERVDFSSDGMRLLSAGLDGTLRLWDSATGIELRRIELAALDGTDKEKQQYTINAYAAFLPGDQTAVTFAHVGQKKGRGSAVKEYGVVQTWDLTTGRQISRYDFPEKQQFALHPSADRFAVFDLNAVVDVERSALAKKFPQVVFEERDLATGELRRSAQYQFPGRLKKDEFVGWAEGVAYSPEGTRLLFAIKRGVSDVTTGVVEYDGSSDTWHNHASPSREFPTYPFVFLSDGRLIDNRGRLWQRETDREAVSFSLKAVAEHGGLLAVSADENTVALGGSDTLSLGDLTSSDDAIPLKHIFAWNYIARAGPEYRYGSLRHAAFSADGARLGTGCEDGTIRIWDLVRGEEIVRCGDIAPSDARTARWEDKRLEAGFGDHGLRLFSATGDEELKVFLGHTAPVICVAASPETGKTISGGADRKLIVWDIETGKPLHHLTGHDAAVCTLLVSPDGRRLVSRGLDNQLLLWDIETGFEITARKLTPRFFASSFRPTVRGLQRGIWRGASRSSMPNRECCCETTRRRRLKARRF